MSFSVPSSSFQTLICAGQHAHNRATFADKYGLFLKDDQPSKLHLTLYSSAREQISHATFTAQGPHDPSLNDSSLAESTTSAEEHSLQSAQEVRDFFVRHESGFTVIHIAQEHSRACLDMTREVFEHLSTAIEIFPALRDTILHLGFRRCEVEIAPPSPRVHLSCGRGDRPTVSGLEIAYGLRFIEPNGRLNADPWSMRQCVIYNKIGHGQDAMRWLFVSAPTLLKRQIRSYMESHIGVRMPSPFEIHILILTTLIPMWRPYLLQIQITLEKYKHEILEAKPNGRGVSTIDGDMSLELKNVEDGLQDAMLAIKATHNTTKVLEKVYSDIRLLEDESSDMSRCHRLDFVALAFAERLSDTELLMEQVTTLINKTRNSSQIVSTFLNLENGHVLRELTSKTHDEGQELRTLSEIATRDAKAVKALSLITVIFLPITVVLNFFSASVVDNSTGTLRLVERWWLSLAVGLPLTICTLLAWSVWILKIKRDAAKGKFSRSGRPFCLPLYGSTADRDVEKNAATASSSSSARS